MILGFQTMSVRSITKKLNEIITLSDALKGKCEQDLGLGHYILSDFTSSPSEGY